MFTFKKIQLHVFVFPLRILYCMSLIDYFAHTKQMYAWLNSYMTYFFLRSWDTFIDSKAITWQN